MQAATRLGLAFLLLITAFVVLVGFAMAHLVLAGQVVVAMVVGLAGVAGVAAGVVTWLVVRREEDEPAPAQPAVPAPRLAPIPRRPLRVQTMPVADLPPAYVEAVTRGMQARTRALRAQSPGIPSAAGK